MPLRLFGQLLPSLSVAVLVTACTAYQHPGFEPRQLGWQSDRDLAPYTQTDSMIAALGQVPGAKARLDSLLLWTDMLNFQYEEAALAYANEAYRLAVEKGYRFSQALAMYYRALLKGRKQINGEGVEDALADARISLFLIKPSDEIDWRIRINGLMGHLYYEKLLENLENPDKKLVDSAGIYVTRALELAEVADMPEKNLFYLQGQLFLDLANLYSLEAEAQADSSRAITYFQKSIDAIERSQNQAALAGVWRNLGIFYLNRDELAKADSALTRSRDYAQGAPNKAGLIYTYQKLGDLKGIQYAMTGNERYFQESMSYLRQCLPYKDENLYYTYTLIAYNYDDRFLQLAGDPPRKYTAEADSAIWYYQLAMQEVQREGVIGYMANLVRNINALCEFRKNLTGEDCSIVLGDAQYQDFLNENYRILVNTIRRDLQTANQRVRKFEQRELAAANQRRVRNNWLISGAGLLFAGLIFLLLLQQLQQKRLQARMEALRAQINPHFISNSLNAIENLVNQNEREAASKYLIHFSRLSRKILNSSRSSVTSLAEELQTLKHFLALEQLRFRDKLSYEMAVAPDLDPDRIQVPALILQPYVENAIWHGIKPKSGPGRLLIRIERQDKQLICIVEDDGIGREKAREMQARSVLRAQHQSHGMRITEERLRAVSRTKGSKLEIVDLRDTEGKPAGTRVIVKLPFRLLKTV